ncbi:hypothetical protein [uncultured Nostoc sp.]|uniref:hypothetical protein n=1 Tax=uncultured Nostoc sp. TaxID=340711 RepID=UPI0035CB9E7C
MQKSKFVLDADIAKCFDRIDHEALLRKLNTSPTICRQIRAWLKAGVMDGKQFRHLRVRHRAGSSPRCWQILPSTGWKNE